MLETLHFHRGCHDSGQTPRHQTTVGNRVKPPLQEAASTTAVQHRRQSYRTCTRTGIQPPGAMLLCPLLRGPRKGCWRAIVPLTYGMCLLREEEGLLKFSRECGMYRLPDLPPAPLWPFLVVGVAPCVARADSWFGSLVFA